MFVNANLSAWGYSGYLARSIQLRPCERSQVLYFGVLQNTKQSYFQNLNQNKTAYLYEGKCCCKTETKILTKQKY